MALQLVWAYVTSFYQRKKCTLEEIASETSNSLQEDWVQWKGPKVHHSPATTFPYPDIYDNTEGIAGFHDLPIPAGAQLLVDVGKYDGKAWLERKYPGLVVVVVDPFRNQICRKVLLESGGADVVTSISVLNVIEKREHRLLHCRDLYDWLKPGGVAFFKVWAGFWPHRGTAQAEIKQGVYQANAWAQHFLPEVREVFGPNVTNDCALNLISAIKQ
jgi:hypothetical protein